MFAYRLRVEVVALGSLHSDGRGWGARLWRSNFPSSRTC